MKQRRRKKRKTNRLFIHASQVHAVHHRGRETSRPKVESSRSPPFLSERARLTRQPHVGYKSAKFTVLSVPLDAMNTSRNTSTRSTFD